MSRHRCIDSEVAQAGAEGLDAITVCGYSKAQGGVMACRMGVSCGNSNDDLNQAA